MVSESGCEPIFNSIKGRFGNFWTSPRQLHHGEQLRLNFRELRVAQAFELALKFRLVLNCLVVGCERPRLLVGDLPEPASRREVEPNEHYDTWMTNRAFCFKATPVALARTLMA